jgi:hypothetical protein
LDKYQALSDLKSSEEVRLGICLLGLSLDIKIKLWDEEMLLFARRAYLCLWPEEKIAIQNYYVEGVIDKAQIDEAITKVRCLCLISQGESGGSITPEQSTKSLRVEQPIEITSDDQLIMQEVRESFNTLSKRRRTKAGRFYLGKKEYPLHWIVELCGATPGAGPKWRKSKVIDCEKRGRYWIITEAALKVFLIRMTERNIGRNRADPIKERCRYLLRELRRRT